MVKAKADDMDYIGIVVDKNGGGGYAVTWMNGKYAGNTYWYNDHVVKDLVKDYNDWEREHDRQTGEKR
jgi:hypothetical protein